MDEMTIYHNPRCSKSRQALQLIEGRGCQPNIILYLDTPPTISELTDILSKLGMAAADLLRKNEAEYKAHFSAAGQLDEAELIRLMVRYPKVIERPIVVTADRAVIGRPPEAVFSLF